MLRIADRALTSWAYATRLLVIVVVAAGLVAALLWLLPIEVRVGPLQITRHHPAN